mmetsp:Transcript_38854/g.69543  ORF Transcript_38854/g.69543 Transcript_38854/m.69543 type:complete len:91 (+) Transcript_38854:1142-1414(+)
MHQQHSSSPKLSTQLQSVTFLMNEGGLRQHRQLHLVHAIHFASTQFLRVSLYFFFYSRLKFPELKKGASAKEQISKEFDFTSTETAAYVA